VKRSLVLSLMTAAMLLIFSAMAEATVADKQVRVHYNDVKVYSNGTLITVPVDQEPFIFNSFTYVPLRVAGQSLNSDITWEASTRSVYITSNPAANIEMATQLAQKDAQITELNKQITALQTQVKDLQTQLAAAKAGSGTSTGSGSGSSTNINLGTIEDDLAKNYNVFFDVRVDSFKLNGNSNEINAEIRVNMSRYNYEWAELTDSDIRSWLVDVTGYIQKKSADSTVVNGQVRTINGERLISFTKNGTKSLQVDYEDAIYRNKGSIVATQIEGDTFYVDTLAFNAFTVSYVKSTETVRLDLEARDSNARTVWETLRESVVNRALYNIGEDVADDFEYEKVPVTQVRMDFYDRNGTRIYSYIHDR